MVVIVIIIVVLWTHGGRLRLWWCGITAAIEMIEPRRASCDVARNLKPCSNGS